MRWSLPSCCTLLATIACGADDPTGSAGCTQVGCEPSVVFELRAKTWSAGDYEVRVDYDQVSIACTFSAPQDIGSANEDAGGDGAPTPHFDFDMNVRCKQTSGKPVRPEIVARDSVTVDVIDTPQSLRVRVTRDGKPLSDDDLKPAYKDFYPNGRACPPHCRVASASILL